jgi:hypothetical protein
MIGAYELMAACLQPIKPYEKPSLLIGNVYRFLLIYELANYNGRLFPMASIA